MDASLFWLFLILSDIAISKKFLVKKSKAYPTGFSSEPASKIPEVPPYAYHCYTKVTGFRSIHLSFVFLPIFSDFSVSKEFLIKK